jgi:peptidoglycan L-alanyl-D-glutamate endopeptidase CwlK
MDTISETRLSQVHPVLAEKIRAVAATMSGSGIELRVVQALRTKAEQDALFAQGRTAPGHIVTNARGGHSMHNYGLAVDMVPGKKGVTPWAPNWDEQDPDFVKMIDLGEAQGLVAGARWQHLPDFDHFQMPGVPVNPTAAMLACLVSGGCEAVWKQFLPDGFPTDAPIINA